MQVTNGATSKFARLLPPPACLKPASTCGANTDHFSGDIQIGKKPSASSAAALHARRADRRGVDRQVRAAVQDALQRLAEARRARSRVRKFILLAAQLGGFLALQDLADDLDVLARAA